MGIREDFSINSSKQIRHVSGTQVYTALAVHELLQDLSDDEAPTGDDYAAIIVDVPSKLDGPRDAAVASRLNLINGFDIDDDAARYINFGSVKQANGDVLYSGLKTLGSIVAGSPMYVVQNGSKLTKFWGNGHIQILVKVKTAGALIDSGKVRVFSRKFGQTYSDFESDLSAGGENPAAMNTAIDSAVVLSEASAAALSSKVAIAVGDTTQDLGNGNGGKLYKGSITLSGGCTVQEAYQYLQYITREDSAATINGEPGWRYRALNAAYPPVVEAPFGTFAGGKWFVAQGWWVTGVLPGESQAYQLKAHDGSTQAPPNVIGITIGNLIAGDRVLVARSSGGALLVNEFTTAGVHASGATVVTVNETVSTDRPTSGVLRIGTRRYLYTSFNAAAKTFTLSEPLDVSIPANTPSFAPYIDKVATSSSESVSFPYAANFSCIARVRLGSGLTPIVPFETTLSVGSGGASANAVRTSDV